MECEAAITVQEESHHCHFTVSLFPLRWHLRKKNSHTFTPLVVLPIPPNEPSPVDFLSHPDDRREIWSIWELARWHNHQRRSQITLTQSDCMTHWSTHKYPTKSPPHPPSMTGICSIEGEWHNHATQSAPPQPSPSNMMLMPPPIRCWSLHQCAALGSAPDCLLTCVEKNRGTAILSTRTCV